METREVSIIQSNHNSIRDPDRHTYNYTHSIIGALRAISGVTDGIRDIAYPPQTSRV